MQINGFLIRIMRKIYYKLKAHMKLGDGFDCDHCPLKDYDCILLCYDLRAIIEKWDSRPNAPQRGRPKRKGKDL